MSVWVLKITKPTFLEVSLVIGIPTKIPTAAIDCTGFFSPLSTNATEDRSSLAPRQYQRYL